jgi:hypothetical protein
MQLDSHIQAIQQELAATSALGDEATAEAARRLGEALAATLHLHLLDLLGEAALEISGQIETGRVEVRLAGRDPELVVINDEAPASRVAEDRDRGRRRPRRNLDQCVARPHDRAHARTAPDEEEP